MACNNSRWKAANQSKDWRIRKRKMFPVQKDPISEINRTEE
jgi:hypothetical protein